MSNEKYTQEVHAPQYKPSGKEVSVSQLVDLKKYKQLMKDISKANVTEEEALFLKLSATRHLVFNYSKIADYYSSAGKEMQKLMEDSALVIIDFEDAIANGYAKLTKQITDIVESKVGATDEK